MPEPYTSSNYAENTGKKLWLLIEKQIMMLRCVLQKLKKNTQKNKNRHKENFEDEANNMRYDKEDTQRSNLNNIYLSVFYLLR